MLINKKGFGVTGIFDELKSFFSAHYHTGS